MLSLSIYLTKNNIVDLFGKIIHQLEVVLTQLPNRASILGYTAGATMARAVWNICASMLTRALTPNKAKLDGVGVIKPHVWKTRVGLLDMDLNVHLNNASYLYNMELARWHLSGYTLLVMHGSRAKRRSCCLGRLNGMLHHCFSKRWMLLVGSQSIRYRHSIAPFQAYEIHSDIVHWDDQWFYFIHRFVCPTTGKLFAEG
ncbi:hypothetical protein DYB32_007328 [Aphanomyces invadans]|uniref:Thioesterase domain-containing protein n=1 Tax=Aphanomyces invadans TaxID=157072 RepID=A0A418AP63_9STRA|nr:hypothetical protein DYB32_007328 [Aphanomyces invadans]